MTPLGYARRRFYVGGWNMQPRRIRFCGETREKAVVYGKFPIAVERKVH
jgi:hypothetical protein